MESESHTYTGELRMRSKVKRRRAMQACRSCGVRWYPPTGKRRCPTCRLWGKK